MQLTQVRTLVDTVIYEGKIAYRCAYLGFYKSDYFLVHVNFGFLAYTLLVRILHTVS